MLIEFAICFPVMLMLIVGGVDIGMLMLHRIELEFATEAAAKCFATHNPNCPTTGAAAVYAAALMPIASPENFTVSTLPCGGAVTSTYTYTPMFLPSRIELGASACYPIDPPKAI